MKKYAVMAFIAFLTISCTLSAQDNNRRRGQEGNRVQQREMRETRERVTVQARTTAPERATPQARAATMARQLELTAEQTAQVQALFERQETQLRQNRQQHQQAQRENREEMRTLRQQAVTEHDAELERIIGSEKMEELRRIRAERARSAR